MRRDAGGVLASSAVGGAYHDAIEGAAAWGRTACVDVQMRKNRKVSSVMGWLLSLQLSEPGAGVCCAVSMLSSRALLRYD